mmetsp:Transcript_13150/g.34266  ORF Transcript_13150/g.34266 Transcript_13150/m.34266 type:complete len:148 (+) Transcript_13150:1-444(+)
MGGCLQIKNDTDKTFSLVHTHSYQMNAWGPFPATIAPQSAPSTYYEYQEWGVNVADDGGDVEYAIDGTSGTDGALDSFHITYSLKNDGPYVVFPNWTTSAGSKMTIDNNLNAGTCATWGNPTFTLGIGGTYPNFQLAGVKPFDPNSS